MFCVIGSGIAGMSCALHLSQLGKVTILTKSKLISGSTPLAQGGIAGVINPDDSFDDHISDTHKAGGNINDSNAVELLVKQAPLEIHYLKELGVPFEKVQHLEGGHSFPRVSNVKDISGKIIAEHLAKHVKNNQNITIIENADVFSLQESKNTNKYFITYNKKDNKYNKNYTISGQYIIIATGGYSSLYNASSSPFENTGDGISLAINAGIHTKDLDKVQFHPTVFNKKRKHNPRLLLTEAIRGFGAKIINTHEEIIIDALQPRDIVSKAIYKEQIKQNNTDCVFLDARNITNFSEHFPFVTEILHNEFHINPTTDLLPITFGAHYCMGGITTTIWGETNKKNIYAIGECANTGVHGNNRLASNSLLEGLVFARQAFKDIAKKIKIKNLETKEKEEIIEEITEGEEFISKEIYTPGISEKFLQKIQHTLSKYISIENNFEQKKNNILKAQELFSKVKKEKNNLSTHEKNILVLVEKLSKDALQNNRI